MKLVDFTKNLSQLWLGANLSQLKTKKEDHNKIYEGKKIPLGVTFALTFVCNFECSHCGADIDNQRAKDDASTKLILDTLDEIKRLGGKRISLTGGEPLVRKGIKDILNKASQNKFYISVVSNGWHVDRHLDQLKKVDLLILSLDGTEEIHDFIRRKKGSYKKVIESIKTAKKNNIPVLVNTTVMNTNADNLKDLSKILKELKVFWTIDLFNDVEIVKDWQQGSNISRPTNNLLNEVVTIGKDNPYLSNSLNYLNTVEKRDISKKVDSSVCFAGIGYCVISPDAKMYPCFPAQHDPEFEGMDLKKMNFEKAFKDMPMYRKTCNTCDVICHKEMNSLYSFKPDAIMSALKYLYKSKIASLLKIK